MTPDDLGIKPEWREAWQWADSWRIPPAINKGSIIALADLALHLCAKLLESEFRWEHDEYTAIVGKACSECGTKNLDPRHGYDEAAWIEAAKGVFEK